MQHSDSQTGGTYRSFFITLAISFVVMYLVMFLNIDRLEHFYLSNTRTYMTLLMVMPMALIKLIAMRKMYTNKKMNTAIALGAVLIFLASLAFLRNQTFIGDEEYMDAMIPHHSSAIMTSQKAQISDPELKKLAEEIIKAQEKEIAQMKEILERLEGEQH
ncbi:MAG: DUF305 domain-containing protein [Flavobacteriales bacterium]|nr:DUF305 domain-containing protein [Flavobacteriales bacterium]